MFFNEWIEIVLYKKKPADLVGTTLGEGIKNLLIASVIYGILFGIVTAISVYTDPEFGTDGALYALIILIVMLIAVPVLSLLGMLIGGGILHILSKAFGGQGTYDNFVGVLAKISASFTGTVYSLIAIILIFASLGGDTVFLIAGDLISIISIIISLWALALSVLAAQAIHKLSLGKAVVAMVVIPLLIVVVVAILIATLVVIAIASTGGV